MIRTEDIWDEINIGRFYNETIKTFKVLLYVLSIFFSIFFGILMYINFEYWQLIVYMIIVLSFAFSYFGGMWYTPAKIRIENGKVYFINGIGKPLRFGKGIRQYDSLNLCKLKLPVINIKPEYYEYALKENVNTELIFREEGNEEKKMIIGIGGLIRTESLIPMREAVKIENWIKEQKEKICKG